jgi:hypothetical protein
MTKKSLFFGTIALVLTALLAMTGCSNPASDDTVVYYAGVEGEVVTAARLAEVLADDGVPGVYALIAQNLDATSDISGILGTAGYTVVPFGVTLNLYGSFTVDTTGDLVVGGIINVQPGSTLTAGTGSATLTIGRLVGESGYPRGEVNVRSGGTLAVSANSDILLAYGNVIAGEEVDPVELTDPQIIAAAGGILAGDIAHGESPNVRLTFGDDSVYLPTVAVEVTTALDLKALANGKFSTSIEVQTTVTEVENLTIRRNTSVILATGTVFKPTGTLTVNGSLDTSASAASTIGVGLTRVVVGLGGELTASQTADTFVDVTDLVVNGEFTSTSAVLSKLVSLTVNGTASVTAATLKSLTTASGAGSLAFLGTWDFGPNAAALLNIRSITSAAAAITANDGFTIPEGSSLTLTATGVTPSGDVTVNGSLIISATTTNGLQLRDGKTLAVTGNVTVTAAGLLKLAEGAKIATAGAGTVTIGKTTFDGTGDWTVTATSGGTAEEDVSGLSITSSANGAAIALVAGSGTRTGMVLTAAGGEGEGPRITQADGASNTLSLASTTLDLSESGSLTLKGAVADQGTLALGGNATPGMIKTGASTGGALATSVTKIGGANITALAIGTSAASQIVLVSSAPDADSNIKLGSITAGHATGPSIVPSGVDDVIFVKDVLITGT